jgi:hypothetical protein
MGLKEFFLCRCPELFGMIIGFVAILILYKTLKDKDKNG